MADPRPQAPAGSLRRHEAIAALARGWALTPLDGKRPIRRRWQQEDPPTEQTVLGWLAEGSNLGLRTGTVSGIVVIDDDTTDGSATASLDLPVTLTVITGSGKRHYYFRTPTDFSIGNSVKTLADGIDVRGDGGQVVFVGSLHPDTRRPYTWAPGLSPDDVPIAALPEHVLERLRPALKQAQPALRIVSADDLAGHRGVEDLRLRPRISAYVQAAVDGEIHNVLSSTEGSRNDTLNRSAFALGQLIGAGALDEHSTIDSLLNAATSIGLSESEATATIASGIIAGRGEPRDFTAALESYDEDHEQSDAEIEDDRPEIQLVGGRLHEIASRAERVLLRQTPPIVYQRGTTLVRLARITQGAAGLSIRHSVTIQEVTAHALVDRLTALIRWLRHDRRSGEWFPVDCPERVAQTLLSRSGRWSLPPLTGIIGCPTLRSDGGILEVEGYDRSSGLYVALAGRIWPHVPPEPTIDEARTALDRLLVPVQGFPFLDAADRSVAMAAILTALIRPSLRTAPLIAFRAAKMGSGKSLLADVVSLIATGKPGAVMSQGSDENEDRKRMLPILAEGEPVAVIDNIERPFGSATLCSILTQTTWRDRVLGKSRTLTLPTTNTTWLATGNNIVFQGDICTRTLVCDLDPRCERPEERRFDVNLHQYVPAHREALVIAGLTVLRAYHVAGRPEMALPVFGRFEEWSDWVRSALVWLGMPDPCETRKRIEEVDPVRLEIAELLRALVHRFTEHSFRVADVLVARTRDDALGQALTPILAAAGTRQSESRALGMFFQRIDRRLEGGLRLVRTEHLRDGARLWRIEHV
ncbi:MAG: bifunctional DNA primase/polymerase [Planctomycetes bacterium]|nr:bifunctional DNA primase/polymerase [Planctomycetota bacterium]